jgi:DNA-binding winged helix-turn-helix (wHTH) protein
VVEGANGADLNTSPGPRRRLLRALIQTISGRGYRFVAPVTHCEAKARPEAEGAGNRVEDKLAPTSITAASIQLRPFEYFARR